MKPISKFSVNLKKLADIYSQKRIAEDTGFSPASINNYINKDSEPSIYFLMQLKSSYNINIDEFLYNENIDFEVKNEVFESEKRFIGNYMIYYYDSSVYKGRVSSYSKNTLSYAVLSVLHGKNNTGKLECRAIIYFHRKDAENALVELNKLESNADIVSFYNQDKDSYLGELETSSAQLYITLKTRTKDDQCFIILNNPPSTNKYIGGIGTANLICRGRERMPCIQYMLLSRQALSLPDGEIYNLLSLDAPEVSLSTETEQITEIYNNLYISQSEFSKNLNEYQKKKIFEDSLENIFSDVIEANMFRFAKISDMEDDKFYRLIKEEVVDGE